MTDAMTHKALKVCHVTTVHDPLDDRIFYRECVTLAEAGYRVVIVAPAASSEVRAGVSLRAIPRPSRRMQRMTSTLWSACRAAVDENADLYHVHDPELLPFGFVLRLFGKQVIYDAHEDLPDDVMAKDWIPGWLRAPVAVLMGLLTRLSGEICSGIVAANPRIARRFPVFKTAIVQNFPRISAATSVAAEDYADRPQTLVYVGSITRIRGIIQMIDALARPVVPRDARLVIAGSFGTYGDPELEQSVRSSTGWQRVDFLGWRSHTDVRALLQSARVGLLLFHPEKPHIEAQPTKLFEYMSAGIPIVASDFPLWREILEGAGCGLVVDPLDCDAIARAIASLLADPQRAEEMGRRGQQAVRSRYGWEPQGDRLLGLYARLESGDGRLAVSHV